MSDLRIEPVTESQYETLLPMIADYQGFYEAEDIRTERNRAFFRRFIAPSDEGELLGAWSEADLVGYACLYWHFSSTRAVETVLMNDLYVDANRRQQGIGRTLSQLQLRADKTDQGGEQDNELQIDFVEAASRAARRPGRRGR